MCCQEAWADRWTRHMALGRVPITRIRFEIPAWPGETNLVGDGVLLAPLGHGCLGVGLRSCFFLSLISWVFLSRLFRFLRFFRFFSRSLPSQTNTLSRLVVRDGWEAPSWTFAKTQWSRLFFRVSVTQSLRLKLPSPYPGLKSFPTGP